ncbi:L-ascorbate metabolism protein UlaG, beta-lactamase superfamily [Frankineae bacterium MT45]|nr:L-ascorbate metabolism protein UlaG, beta-lactamase superfamily [Frankineae bacterium MT45]
MSGPSPRSRGDDLSVTWWGHASTTIELAGCRVLTDPLFSTRLAHLRRVGGPVPVPDARRADVVVISHLHRDHLHTASLAELPPSTRVIAPRGASAAVARAQPKLAERFEEIDVGESITVGGVRIEAVPAAHDGRRAPRSRFRATALGYRLGSVDADAPRVWFAGDTGLFDGMREIGPVEVAVVPVGGWGPTLGDEHLDPEQACEAVQRVGARDAVPIHFGTYWPTGLRRAHPTSFRRLCQEPGSRFVAALAASQPQTRAHLLALGQRVELPGPR